MRRVSVAKTGLFAATVLIALVLAFGVVPTLAGHGAAPGSAAHGLKGVHAEAVHTNMGSVGPANVSVSAAFTSHFSSNGLPYFVLPYNITWNVSVVNGTITPVNGSVTNLYQQLNVTWLTSGCGPFTFPCLTLWTSAVNPAWETNGTATSGSFKFPLALSNLTSSTYLGFDLPQGQWQFSVYENYDDLNGNQSSFQVEQAAFMAATPPTGTITQPTAGENLTAGHTVIAGYFSGYFVTTANVTVYNGTGATVLTDPVYAPGTQQHPFAVSWPAVTPGTYKIVLTLTSAWHQTYHFNTTATIVAGIPLTYFNSTSSSLIPGLSNGGSAALLVTLGAIIGMIVMAVVGRGMWGGGTKPAAAQPWNPATSPSTTGTMGGPSEDTGGGSGGSGGMGGSNPPS